MEFNQANFARILEQLKDNARLQGNMLTSGEISEAFDAWKLEEPQLLLIHEYFHKNHIGIDEPGDAEENLSGDDVNFLEMYLAELRELPDASDGEKRAVMMSALAGDGSAQARLVEIFLPQVVEISKLYAGQGVFLEDLIGEGNVAVAAGVTMLGALEHASEAEGMLGKMIMDAMEEYIAENAEEVKKDQRILDKVNRVAKAANELYAELHRKVTIEEVMQESGLSRRSIEEAIRMSGDKIEALLH